MHTQKTSGRGRQRLQLQAAPLINHAIDRAGGRGSTTAAPLRLTSRNTNPRWRRSVRSAACESCCRTAPPPLLPTHCHAQLTAADPNYRCTPGLDSLRPGAVHPVWCRDCTAVPARQLAPWHAAPAQYRPTAAPPHAVRSVLAGSHSQLWRQDPGGSSRIWSTVGPTQSGSRSGTPAGPRLVLLSTFCLQLPVHTTDPTIV